VLGAGAGGLGAACWLKEKGIEFMCVEGLDSVPANMHNGVHYLHSIPSLPFDAKIKSITLTDGILFEEKIYHEPNLSFSLKYSEKVREIQHPSSIMDIGKHDKVYMPENNSLNKLVEDMYENAGKENFHFGYWFKGLDLKKKSAAFEKQGELFFVEYEQLISTIPLDRFRASIENEFINNLQLNCNPVYVTNFKVEKIVPNWMINLYIPNSNTPIYRASILNNVCSVESIRELKKGEQYCVREILEMFHLIDEDPEYYTWKTGKVLSISIDDRMKLVEKLKELSIYSIGRFGLWNRKLLVDSTINQAKLVVEHLIEPNTQIISLLSK